MRILLVEPDRSAALSIESVLRAANFNVYSTNTGEEGFDLARIYEYDLVITEIILPDLSGHEIIRKLRLSKIETPTMVLSNLIDTNSKIKAFGFGADDYLTKPFIREELIARIQALVRRSKGHSHSVIQTGEIRIDLNDRVVEVNGEFVHLTGKEYQMFELLSLRKGTTVTSEMFLNHLYGGMDEPESKIIDVFIAKLRKKLSHATGGNHHIETVWGRGYRLRDPST
jgi:two-component system cell cycle response regulator CtrA